MYYAMCTAHIVLDSARAAVYIPFKSQHYIKNNPHVWKPAKLSFFVGVLLPSQLHFSYILAIATKLDIVCFYSMHMYTALHFAQALYV